VSDWLPGLLLFVALGAVLLVIATGGGTRR
jgi:hypothetical protein